MSENDILQIQLQLSQWYQQHQRSLPWRGTGDPYKIWISEVMLQQTQVKTVLPYYQSFLERFPDVHTLAQADLQTLLKNWEGLGYYARARNLHKAAQIVSNEMQGMVPDDYGIFRKLPGVGNYIAAAVLSIAFHQPFPVVDGNVKRVLARLFCLDKPVNHNGALKTFQQHAELLLDRSRPGEFNQAMMELGATVCRPANPTCRDCPLRQFCLAYKRREVEKFPIRLATRPIPEYRIAVGVVFKNHHVLITRRKPAGLLGGLWEFPGGKINANESAEQACIREIKEEVSLKVEIIDYLTQVKHAYTHFKIIVDVFRCRFLSGEVRLTEAEDYRWINLDDIDSFPFPAANLKFIPLLKNNRIG